MIHSGAFFQFYAGSLPPDNVIPGNSADSGLLSHEDEAISRKAFIANLKEEVARSDIPITRINGNGIRGNSIFLSAGEEGIGRDSFVVSTVDKGITADSKVLPINEGKSGKVPDCVNEPSKCLENLETFLVIKSAIKPSAGSGSGPGRDCPLVNRGSW